MSRLHLKFRNVDARVVRALTQTMEAKPWRRHTNEARRRVAQELADRIVDAYRVPYVLVVRTASDFGLDFNPDSTSYLRIRRDGWDTLTLLSGIRLFVQTSKHHDQGDEVEVDNNLVWAWACSALYIVSPTVFRALARTNKVEGVKAIDTYSSETWTKIMEAGYGDDDGDLTTTTEIVATFLLTGERHVDDEVPADGSCAGLLESEMDSLFTAEDDEEGFDPDDDDYEPEEHGEDPGDAETADDYDASTDVDDDDDEDVASEAPATTGRFTGGDDGLDDLGIVKLRRLSRGRVSGGYSMRSPDLIAALRDAGVTASDLGEDE